MGSQSPVNSRCALVRAPAACGTRPPARFTMEEPDVANRHGGTARIQNALGSEPLQDEAASSHAQDDGEFFARGQHLLRCAPSDR
jgi:hypothetical protein